MIEPLGKGRTGCCVAQRRTETAAAATFPLSFPEFQASNQNHGTLT